MNDGRGKTYTVKSGDSAASIAKDIYGNERMMAEILRLNGGVKTLRSGMVLRLPRPKDNEDIFISNDWAANMGMATTDQLKEYYAANPGGRATSDFNQAGFGWKNSTAGGGAGVPTAPKPPVPMTPDQIAATRATAGRGTNANFSNLPNPNGTDRTKDDTGLASYAAQRALAGRSTGVNRYLPVAQNQGPTIPSTSGPNVIGPVQGPTIGSTQGPNALPLSRGEQMAQGNKSAQAFAASAFAKPVTPQIKAPLPPSPTSPIPSDPYGYYRRYNNPATAGLGTAANTVTGALPPGAQVSTGAQAGQNGKNTATEFTPQQAFALPDNYQLTPTPTNQDPLTLSTVAPYVQQAMQVLTNAELMPPGKSGFTLSQANLLVQAGVIAPGSEAYTKMMDIISGVPDTSPTAQPSAGGLTPEGNGSWDVYNLGGEKMPVWWKSGGGGGGGGQALNDYSGYVANSFGPSLGLTNWRGI
jgi:hypothetical protein